MKLNFKKLGRGQPIIILHGFLGTLDNWITVGKDLASGYEVWVVDQRNHGLSPMSDDFDYNLLVGDLHEFITDHNIINPILMGHSMGGKTVMHFSQKYSDLFSKLIIVDIAPRFYPVHHQKILEGLLSIEIESLKDRNEADEQLAKYVDEFGIRQFLLKNLNRVGKGFEWKANIKVLSAKIDNIGEEVKGGVITEKPVYFIGGGNSVYIGKSDREDIKTLYPNAQILSIKDAGHWVHAEQQEAFIKTVRYLIK